jgi:hypothetical protein
MLSIVSHKITRGQTSALCKPYDTPMEVRGQTIGGQRSDQWKPKGQWGYSRLRSPAPCKTSDSKCPLVTFPLPFIGLTYVEQRELEAL